jgi:excisionase family DNA binding protein
MTEKHYTIKEVAEQSRLSVSWWRQRISKKEMRYLKIGRRVFVPESTLQKMFTDGIVETTEG